MTSRMSFLDKIGLKSPRSPTFERNATYGGNQFEDVDGSMFEEAEKVKTIRASLDGKDPSRSSVDNAPGSPRRSMDQMKGTGPPGTNVWRGVFNPGAPQWRRKIGSSKFDKPIQGDTTTTWEHIDGAAKQINHGEIKD